MTSVLVVVPTFNELDNITALIDRIFSVVKALPLVSVAVLVVDGNSSDGTAEAVKRIALLNQNVSLIIEEKKEGLGKAYAKGFKWGLQRNFDFIIEMDADFSHDPAYLPEMLRLADNADLVVGSRYVDGGGTVGWGLLRRLISWGASFYTRVITGLPVKDVTGGFKCFRRAVLTTIPYENVQTYGYGFQIEMNYRVWKAGFKIVEFPIIFPDRQKGVSKFNNTIFWEAFFLVWKLRFGLN